LDNKLTLSAKGDGFLLQKGKNGRKTTLSADDVLLLGQSALQFRQQIMSRHRPGAVFATPVHQINATWNALGEAVLMEMQFQPSGNLIFEVAPENLRSLIDRLEVILQERPDLGLKPQ